MEFQSIDAGRKPPSYVPVPTPPCNPGPTWADLGFWIWAVAGPALVWWVMSAEIHKKVAVGKLDQSKLETAACDAQLAKLSPKAIEKVAATAAISAAETVSEAKKGTAP